MSPVVERDTAAPKRDQLESLHCISSVARRLWVHLNSLGERTELEYCNSYLVTILLKEGE